MKLKNQSTRKETIPPLEFQSLLLPFYSQALLKLGKLAPIEEQSEHINLELANRLIALLDLMKTKTKGNLEEIEQDILDRSLVILKSFYLEAVNKTTS